MSSVEETKPATAATTNGAVQTEGSMPVVRVSVPKRSARSELRAIKIVWRREIIRFKSDRLRIITSLVQPFLFLFVLGSGLQQIAAAGTHGVNLKTFIYPGILCITVMFTAMFSAASIVWDREFGFLREMMVAPVRRSSLVIGKVLGGATVACSQGLIVLAIAPLVHVPYAPLMLLGIFGIQVLLALAVTSFGVMIAARIKQMQSFMAIMQMIITPLYFISGALFPAQGLPTWLTILNRLDPIAYAVDPMRRLVFAHIPTSPLAKSELAKGITWFGWRVPSLIEVLMVALIGAVMLSIAIWEFSSSE
jgi:ABC-2 type transport system permease protein